MLQGLEVVSLKASLGQLKPPCPLKELTRAYPREILIKQKFDHRKSACGFVS